MVPRSESFVNDRYALHFGNDRELQLQSKAGYGLCEHQRAGNSKRQDKYLKGRLDNHRLLPNFQ